jgi:hypothetical protein
MDELVLASEVEVLLDLLQECWSEVIKEIDGSDIDSVREMISSSRLSARKSSVSGPSTAWQFTLKAATACTLHS